MTGTTNITLHMNACPGGEGGGAGVIVGPEPPSAPATGQLWWDTVGGQLYVWTANQWVAASCCEGGGGGIPDAPSNGNIYGRENGQWVVLLDDGTY